MPVDKHDSDILHHPLTLKAGTKVKYINFTNRTLSDGAGSKFNFFLEYSHVAYQIKGNDDACSNMVANILPVDTRSTWGVFKAFFLKL